MSRTPTADEVADYLITLAHQRGESVNNLKLQRLLYYVQAWHLALYDRPLFDARFQAWMSGPVIPSVFWRFDAFGIRDLPMPRELPGLGTEARAFLDEYAPAYLSLDEWELGDMSRDELPYLNARGDRQIGEPCEAELSEDDMRVYFRHLEDAA